MKTHVKFKPLHGNESLITALDKLSGNRSSNFSEVKVLSVSPFRFILNCDDTRRLKEIKENKTVAKSAAVELIDRLAFPPECSRFISELKEPEDIMDSMLNCQSASDIPEIEGYVLDFIAHEVEKFTLSPKPIIDTSRNVNERSIEISNAISSCLSVLNINPYLAFDLFEWKAFNATRLGLLFKNLLKDKKASIDTLLDFVSIGNIKLIDNDVSFVEFLTTYDGLEKLSNNLIEVVKAGSEYFFFNVQEANGTLDSSKIVISHIYKSETGVWLCENYGDLNVEMHDICGSLNDLKRLPTAVIEHIEKYK